MPGGENTITPQPENANIKNWRGKKKQILQMEKRKSEKKIKYNEYKKNTTKAAEPRFMRSYYYFPHCSFPFYLIT